jgi:hypothetical protein
MMRDVVEILLVGACRTRVNDTTGTFVSVRNACTPSSDPVPVVPR